MGHVQTHAAQQVASSHLITWSPYQRAPAKPPEPSHRTWP